MSENHLFGEDMEAGLCDRLLTENDRLYQRIGALESSLTTTQSEVAQLREALKFYANPKSYSMAMQNGEYVQRAHYAQNTASQSDRGDIARAALALATRT